MVMDFRNLLSGKKSKPKVKPAAKAAPAAARIDRYMDRRTAATALLPQAPQKGAARETCNSAPVGGASTAARQHSSLSPPPAVAADPAQAAGSSYLPVDHNDREADPRWGEPAAKWPRLMDDATVDKFLASQEDDEPRVVWRASPQVAHPRRAVPQHSTPAPSGAVSAAGDTPPSASSDSQGSMATGSEGSNASLRARLLLAVQSGRSGGGARAAAPRPQDDAFTMQPSRLSNRSAIDEAASTAPDGQLAEGKSPNTGSGAGNQKRRLSLTAPCGGSVTPLRAVRPPQQSQQDTRPSSLRKSGRVDSHARQAGRKRKALLELLDQVENIVHTRGVPSATQESSLVPAPVSVANQTAAHATTLSQREVSQPVVLTEIAVLADEELHPSICPSTSESPIPVPASIQRPSSKDSGPILSRYSNSQPSAPYRGIATPTALRSSQPIASNPASTAQQPLVVDRSTPASVRRRKAGVQSSMGIFSQYPALEGLQEDLDDELMQMLAEADRHVASRQNGSQAIPGSPPISPALPASALPTDVIVSPADRKTATRHAFVAGKTGVACNLMLPAPFSRGLHPSAEYLAPQDATASLGQSVGVSTVAKQGSQLARPISAAAAPVQNRPTVSVTEALPPFEAATGFALPLQGAELHTNSGVFANMSDEDDDWCDIAEPPAGIAAYPTQPTQHYANLHVRPEQSVGVSDTAVAAASRFDSLSEAPAGPRGGSLPAPEMPLVGSSTRDELPLAGERRRLHHVVLEVLDGGNTKTLRLLNEYTCVETIAHLHDCWVETPVAVGDPVNLIAQVYSHEGVLHAVLDNDAGLLIIHPDVLLSGTRITSSLQCIRKAALEERYPGSSNAKALEGTLLHDLLQAALAENLRSPEALRAHAEHLVATNTKELLEVGLDEAAAMERLADAVPNMLQWMSTYVADHLQPASLVDMGYSSTVPAAQRMCIQEVTDIEESVWAPKYGIKGNIDATLMVAFEAGAQQQQHRQRVQTLGQQPQLSAVLAPFEFKTGKPHMSHRAQVSLYLLLLEERYGSLPDVGLLWYINQQGPMAVKRTHQELAALLMKRNELAASMVGGRGLPPMIRDASKYGCTKCFSVNACAVAHKALEGGNAESAGMGDAFHRETGHLSAQHSAFLAHWHHLLDLEETGLQEKRSEIWRLHGSERQDGRRCIAGLRMKSHVKASEPSSQGDWLYTFCRVTAAAGKSPPPKALNVSGMLAGEMVVLSLEGRHPQVARSFVHAALPDSITLALHRPLRAGLLQQGQEVGMSWRIDKDESGTLNTRMRGSLMALAGSNRRSARLRALLVDLQAPRIPDVADDCRSPSISGTGNRWYTSEEATEEIPDDLPVPEGGAKEVGNEGSAGLPPSKVEEQVAKPLIGRAALEVIAARLGAQLNGEQQLAVQRVLMGADYNLVLGMPGAGKTTTIVAAVTALAAAGRSVLLTSYTNSAVDNILLKLRKEGVDFLRLGRTSGVHPGVADALPGGTRHPAPNVAAMRQLAATSSVVACTCLSTNSPLLARRTFDVCIVDEASQITLPATLGALLKARTFVLVGDHNQLPPLVTNAAAEAGGLSKSLFRLLSEAHPQAVVALREQFRMNSDIMTLSNTLVYSGQLRCGSQAVADGMLVLPRQLTAEEAPPWLLEVLRPERRVVFLDTDALSAGREESAADAMCNKAEAALLLRVVGALVSGGMLDSAIGAISPYRSQVALLERLAVEQGLTGMEALTVDKSQGRDKDCVLVSFVRSNEGANAGRLLADWRRINVAITRARHKLVLIGSAKTLASVPLFRHLLELVRQRQWCIDLPTDALE